MISNTLDERMLFIRGKALLYGFVEIIILLMLKNFLITVFNVQVESLLQVDFSIIYVSTFTVSMYMLKNDGISENIIVRTRYIYLLLSTLFTILIVTRILSREFTLQMHTITNSFTLLAELVFTILYTILIMKKYNEITGTLEDM